MAQLCGVKAPRHVYSGTLTNSSEHDVDIEIEYGGSDESHKEVVNASVPKGGSHTIEGKTASTGEHEQNKVVQKITVKRPDGTTKELTAPFEGVTSPQKNWQFEIGEDGAVKSQSK